MYTFENFNQKGQWTLDGGRRRSVGKIPFQKDDGIPTPLMSTKEPVSDVVSPTDLEAMNDTIQMFIRMGYSWHMMVDKTQACAGIRTDPRENTVATGCSKPGDLPGAVKKAAEKFKRQFRPMNKETR